MAFLDGELGSGLRSKVARHLEGCPSCRKELEAYARVSSVLKGMSLPPFPDDLSAERILRMAAAEQAGSKGTGLEPADPPRNTPRWLWKPALALGSVMTLIVFWRAYPYFRSLPVPTQDEVLVAEKMGLFENLELMEDLTTLELIMHGEGANEGAG